MSRRQGPPRGRGGLPAPHDPAPRAAGQPREGSRTTPPEPTTTLRERFQAATVPAAALLPLRFFLGITFLYAGIDKLIDPAFFDASSPASIMGQMAAFTHASPIASLVKLGEPFALEIGILVAFAEIAIGLGALTGLAFRVAAAGGAAVAILFFLTASWGTQPYYYGPDLPYAVGWITLALAGHGGLLVPRRVRDLGRDAPPARAPGRSASAPRGDGWNPRPSDSGPAGEAPTLTRRTLLQVGLLAGAAFLVGSATAPFRILRGDAAARTPGATGPTATPASTPPPGASPVPAPTSGTGAGATGLTVANVSDLGAANAVAFTVPTDVPSSLPAGDPGVIVKLSDGSFVAYDAVCTHQGCTVEWDAADGVLLCPCHGAAFDPAHRARVLQGPARRPLAALPITVDPATGAISLTA